ncbi:MAG: ribonuclease Z [Flavobacteriaceae bacterium]|nr:ribonuclease Z [Flavobacteriaceae bacterium]
MKINRHPTFIYFKAETSSLEHFILEVSKSVLGTYEKQNVIVNLLTFGTLSENDLVQFLELSSQHRANKNSFVLVSRDCVIDHVSDELIIVPTLQEAEDIIEMETIERDLGF